MPKGIESFFARQRERAAQAQTTPKRDADAIIERTTAEESHPGAEDAGKSARKRRKVVDDEDSDEDDETPSQAPLSSTTTTATATATTTTTTTTTTSLADMGATPKDTASDSTVVSTASAEAQGTNHSSPSQASASASSAPEATPPPLEKDKAPVKDRALPKVYTPDSDSYHPINDATWHQGEPVPYLALASTFAAIEATSKRLRIIEILSNFFRSVIALSPQQLLPCLYLCTNSLAPAYQGIELGIGDTVVMKAIAESTGRALAKIKADALAKGDLGLVAQESRTNQRTLVSFARLTVTKVYSTLHEIALMSGNSVMTRKIGKIKSLLVAGCEMEPCYIIRSLGGKLRIGLAEASVLVALGRAVAITPPGKSVLNACRSMSADDMAKCIDTSVAHIKRAYCELPSFDAIVPVLIERGVEALETECTLTPGIPLKPMLAHPTKGIAEVLRRFENNAFTCEYKYDGERAQVHLQPDGKVRIFSRNSEDLTSKYPDVVSRIPDCIDSSVQSFIIDCESVAWDREKEHILPFQVLSTRKRKDASEDSIKVQVCLFAFDLLYLNGTSYVQRPLGERRTQLHTHFKASAGTFMYATSMDATNTEDIEEFLDESIKGNCEGLMVKTLAVDATYEISKRSRSWLKVKKDYLEGVGDTLDLVVIGGFIGKGKRTGTYGGFLLACYDADNEEFQSICKIGTGFSDDDLAKHTGFFKEHVLEAPKPYYRFGESVKPDVWFEPVQVWEVKAADLSISPVHQAAAGLVDPERGISLRFPRFLHIREDKRPEDATSASQVATLYRAQDINAPDQMQDDDMY